MFDKFFPDEYVASTYVIAFEKLYEEGYRGVIFDIDNTLVPHGKQILFSKGAISFTSPTVFRHL